MPSDAAVKPKRTNRLIHETSPYLLQHAHNPVDWHPWGEEALERARNEDKPIFLSIGYSACHWCHVMERESFENERIAAILNEHFISIKVDREERPDLDDIYMRAVQILTGSGGWPMSVFLTPNLEPFYAGAYFPPRDMYGKPGFETVLLAVLKAWNDRRGKVLTSAKEIAGYIRELDAQRPAPDRELNAGAIAKAAEELLATFDRRHGGFGGAPKFPQSPAIALLLRQYLRTGERPLLEAAELTLKRMAYGGMYDQLGGGFHRYSVDEQWFVPHFEKMLYDNAQLSEVYLEAFQLTGNPLYRRVAQEIFEYVLRDMQGARGAFLSSEDADSEGQEGAFYLWRYEEVLEVLGEEDARVFCKYYGVEKEGNFVSHEPYHRGRNILHVAHDPGEVAKEFGMTQSQLEVKRDQFREKLLVIRQNRVRPALDDKILVSWNALMISAFAKGYQVVGDERYRAAAEQAADFILTKMVETDSNGRRVLLRTHRNGQSRLPGYLDDYAFLTVALVDLYEATFNPKWLAAAAQLAQEMVDRYWDPVEGGFFFATADRSDLIVRTKPLFDGAEPSGNAMAALGLLRLAKLTGNTDYAERAAQTLRSAYTGMMSMPRAHLKTICALDFHLDSAKEIAIVGAPSSEAVRALLDTVHSRFIPNKVLALLDPSKADAAALEGQIPLLAGKRLRDGRPAAYICKDFTCLEPVTTPEALIEALAVK